MNMRAKAKVLAVTLAVPAVAIFAGSPPTEAFIGPIHRQITEVGLGPGQNFSFLRAAVLQDITDQHPWMDDRFPSGRASHDEKHFDDCEFDKSAAFIGEQYAGARGELSDLRLWGASYRFGNALHTVQDFYSHSNWVELGFPRTDDDRATPGVEVAQSDLVDLSGAQSSLARRWFAPAGGAPLRGDILLGGDDWDGIPLDWSITRNGGGLFVPTLIDAQGRTRGRLLVTGKGKGDTECNVSYRSLPVNAYTGIKHGNLNKDNHESGAADVPVDERRVKHARARALATLQTGYEWCRLVRNARLADRDGILLAMWVRAGGNPHPPGTPCRSAPPGPTRVVVTVESIRILDAGEEDGERGEIQLAAVLYDDPLNFHRSVHVSNRSGRMGLDAGDFVPPNQLPAPLSLCVSQGKGATFTLHAWDNDDALNDRFALDFDNYDDDDEVLVGFRRQFGARLPSGVQVARSADLEVRFRVGRTAEGLNPDVFCPPEAGPPRLIG